MPVRATVCASVPVKSGDATADIQNALDSCKGKHQVVALAAGTYHVSATLQVPDGTVLRGTGTWTVRINGEAYLAHLQLEGGAVDQHIDDAAHVFVGGAAHVATEHALDFVLVQHRDFWRDLRR